ncbi:DinB family protein [Acinetobacter venetianus]|uniref:DinB family protein n=1 Tax=Acinetobacter venetianus TaxID=52133 RepID=A0A150HL78_9GAMM|nr:DinB family protein [Acinetobacter venetianus]KXZ64777.1 DinB family protein [Acinetobacter venetianus]
MNYHFKTYFLMLTHYNQWANNKLFAVLEALSEAQLNQDCGAYFNSLIQTANHVLVGDFLWFERICGLQPSGYALDDVLYPDVQELIKVRKTHDQSLIDYVQVHDESAFHQPLTYIRRNQTYTEPLIEVLAHMFNHQTHHRGQMHNMVFQLTGISLELDLIYFQRENACLYR